MRDCTFLGHVDLLRERHAVLLHDGRLETDVEGPGELPVDDGDVGAQHPHAHVLGVLCRQVIIISLLSI